MAAVPVQTAADSGALLRSRRRALGLNQAAFAKRMGASRLWLSEIEARKPGANLGLVLRAFDALGLRLVATTGETAPATGEAPPVEVPDIDAIIAGARRTDRA